jgi:uncharacterized membrane protein
VFLELGAAALRVAALVYFAVVVVVLVFGLVQDCLRPSGKGCGWGVVVEGVVDVVV